MTPWYGITGIRSITRCCGGLWRYLIVRDRGQTAVELECERNRATAEAIVLLPVNSELLEYEPNGRLRVIRKAAPDASAPVVISQSLPRPGGELHR